MEHYEPKSISPEQLEKVKAILNDQQKRMKKYKVNAKIVSHLQIVIDAFSYEDAVKIAEYELIADDFEAVSTAFILGEITEAN